MYHQLGSIATFPNKKCVVRVYYQTHMWTVSSSRPVGPGSHRSFSRPPAALTPSASATGCECRAGTADVSGGVAAEEVERGGWDVWFCRVSQDFLVCFWLLFFSHFFVGFLVSSGRFLVICYTFVHAKSLSAGIIYIFLGNGILSHFKDMTLQTLLLMWVKDKKKPKQKRCWKLRTYFQVTKMAQHGGTIQVFQLDAKTPLKKGLLWKAER